MNFFDSAIPKQKGKKISLMSLKTIEMESIRPMGKMMHLQVQMNPKVGKIDFYYFRVI